MTDKTITLTAEEGKKLFCTLGMLCAMHTEPKEPDDLYYLNDMCGWAVEMTNKFKALEQAVPNEPDVLDIERCRIVIDEYDRFMRELQAREQAVPSEPDAQPAPEVKEESMPVVSNDTPDAANRG